MKKTAKLVSILLVALLTLTACSGGGKGSSELRIASDAEPATFDIQATNDTATTRVAKQIFEPLLKQDEDLNLVPALAESWEAKDDTTYVFKLKQGVKFHNGEDFTAKDVEYTLKRAKESASIGHIVGSLDVNKIKVIDEYTIEVGTEIPFGPLLTHLAHPATGIMNEKAVNDAGEDLGTSPVGTGPYKLKSWSAGSEVVLEKNEDYHGDKAKMETVVFKTITEPSVREVALENGEVDIAFGIAPQDISKVEANENLTMVRDYDLSTSYVGFNIQRDTPLKIKEVRQAINYAVDVDAVLEAVYLGVGKAAKGPLNSQAFGANPNLEVYSYDVDKAKELLAEAGYADGFEISLFVGDNNAQRIQIAQIVKEELSKIGITVNINQLEWSAFLTATENGEHDMYILGWTTVTTDGDYGLFPLFHSDQFGAAGNRAFYANDEVDALLEDARYNSNQDEREVAYFKAQEIINDEAPWIFLQEGENLTGISNKVKGFKHHPTATHYLSQVSVED